ncbi:MAG: radical SAM protein [Thermodesulfobacteriota bacterium]|nr:radical SAM protein [Thermodesulfobacteriota bacterium]
MKKVMLIFPRFRYPSGDIPTGLLTIAAFLRQQMADLELTFLDASFNPSWPRIQKLLVDTKPDIAGIFMDVLMAEDGLKVAALAAKNGASVITGGPHPTMVPDQVIAHDGIHAVCIGEGEYTLKAYIEAFYSDKDFSRVDGIWYRERSAVRKNPVRPFLKDLDALPSPAYDLLDMKRYIAHFFQLDSFDPRLRGISLTVSRGCPYDCTFCQPTVHKTLGRRVRIRSPEAVVSDLKLLTARYRLNSFYLADDLIAVVPGWFERFCRCLHQNGINLAWACNTRADTLDADTLQTMKDAGLAKIKIGIESVTDRIRNGIYNKRISLADITGILESAEKLGIQTKGFFMIGAPTETPAEVRDTVMFAVRSPLAEALFSVTTPFPGSKLHAEVIKRGWHSPSKPEDYNYYQVNRPRMSALEISPARLAIYKKFANLCFYLHPVRWPVLKRALTSMDGLRKLTLKLRRI